MARSSRLRPRTPKARWRERRGTGASLETRGPRLARVLLWLALGGCGDAAERSPAPDLDPAALPADTVEREVALEVDEIADPDDPWTTGMVRREFGPLGTATLSDARAARHEGFDRLVLEFAGDTVPTYQVEYIEGPAIQCGSGEPIRVEGGGVLLVRLEGANAHDDAGYATVRNRRLNPGLPVLLEARLICDFEAHVDWALGVTTPTAFRILELRDPARLAIDVKHLDPPP